MFLNGSQLAAELGVSVSTLARWRELGMPSIQTPGGRHRYDVEDVKDWLEADEDDCSDEESEEDDDEDEDSDDELEDEDEDEEDSDEEE